MNDYMVLQMYFFHSQAVAKVRVGIEIKVRILIVNYWYTQQTTNRQQTEFQPKRLCPLYSSTSHSFSSVPPFTFLLSPSPFLPSQSSSLIQAYPTQTQTNTKYKLPYIHTNKQPPKQNQVQQLTINQSRTSTLLTINTPTLPQRPPLLRFLNRL